MISQDIEKGIDYLKSVDKTLAKIIDASDTCNIKPRKFYYRALLSSIIGQQLSGKAASSILKKFYAKFGKNPKPEMVAAADDEELRSCGLSGQKTKYSKILSQMIVDGELSLKGIAQKSDEEIIELLTKVKGIGIWTAQMFLMFTLARLDVLPLNDLGIRKAIMINYKLRAMPDEKKIIAISKKNKWSPYNTIACWYMWRSLDTDLIFD